MMKLENQTAVQIVNMSFRLFVEKGYEATNLREIGSEVGINASTIYFYYKSKKDLFLDVLEYALKTHINELQFHLDSILSSDLADPLQELYYKEIEGIYKDSALYLFLLRYRMFPVYELKEEINLLIKTYDEQEFLIWKQLLLKNSEMKSKDVYLQFLVIMKTVNGIINEMLISGEAMKRQSLEKLWVFCLNYRNEI